MYKPAAGKCVPGKNFITANDKLGMYMYITNIIILQV